MRHYIIILAATVGIGIAGCGATPSSSTDGTTTATAPVKSDAVTMAADIKADLQSKIDADPEQKGIVIDKVTCIARKDDANSLCYADYTNAEGVKDQTKITVTQGEDGHYIWETE